MEFYSKGSPATAKRYRYTFGATRYDALNRLKGADFSSWSGSAWTTTLAFDLAGITYDPAGNLTALQRYRETATLLDNLTYTNATTSNRLNSVTDAVATTAETWDAETGSFTYDANGNLKTAPAPYSLTAVTYDPANLPLSITRSGVTTTYRYDGAGQRVTKQVGTGNTEVYLRDGATTLGVFTVNAAGTSTSWHFNLLWEGRVVGRQPNTGNRRFYHFDHLGSTRAVVDGAAIVESYDFEPWGLLMPGRTLGSGTKEGFTSKERDAETGLDYFGARYYMPALARWASVDPLADVVPEWNAYNYAFNKPQQLIDPDGRLSTHTDEDGNVLAVYNDGDLGVYKHEQTTRSDLDACNQAGNTSCGGTRAGETENWDEFLSPETGKIFEGARIEFGSVWDNLIEPLHDASTNMGLPEIAQRSRPGGLFDIKADMPSGPGTGRLLKGKYATARSAGNYLAGYNASGRRFGTSLSLTTFLKLAGALNTDHWSKWTALDILMFGRAYGPPPNYGESEYTARMIRKGWYDGAK